MEVRNLRQLREFLHRVRKELSSVESMAEKGYPVEPVYKVVLSIHTSLGVVLERIDVSEESLRKELDDLKKNVDALYGLFEDRVSEDSSFLGLSMGEDEEFKGEVLNLVLRAQGKVDGLIDSIGMLLEVLSDASQGLLVTRKSPGRVTMESSTMIFSEREIPSRNFNFEVEFKGERVNVPGVVSFLLGRDENTGVLTLYELDVDKYGEVVSLINNIKLARSEEKRDIVRRHIKRVIHTFAGRVYGTMSREHIVGVLSERDNRSIILFDVGRNYSRVVHNRGSVTFPGKRSGNSVLVEGYAEIWICDMKDPIIVRRIR